MSAWEVYGTVGLVQGPQIDCNSALLILLRHQNSPAFSRLFGAILSFVLGRRTRYSVWVTTAPPYNPQPHGTPVAGGLWRSIHPLR